VMLYEQYQHAMGERRACLTVHNFRHQGVCGEEILKATNLHPTSRFMCKERLADDSRPGAVNLLKGGIVYSNFTTTVSPRHAWETRLTGQGEGMGHTLHVHQDKFGGILNGVNYDLWNPEIDPLIVQNYSVNDPDGKYVNKRALRERFLLRDVYKPIVAYVGRLDEQKGVDLIRHAMFYSLDQGAQFVLLGSSPNPAIQGHFEQLKGQLNDNPDVHLELAFTNELAHLIYAGADILVMPSMFEPCGLAQLIAMKYGTVPAVRAIGGLADTVFDRDHSDQPWDMRNGYVFHQTDNSAVESALHRAIGLWNAYPDEFRELMLNGMRADYSWASSGQHYLNIYEHIRHK
jgi:starch synthase